MKESALWGKIKDPLNRLGKFQKISDRFTPGIPDALGIYKTRGWAIELKEFSGVHTVKVKFRPGQLSWLKEWHDAGGVSLIVVSHKLKVLCFRHFAGERLEQGLPLSEALEMANVIKDSRSESYGDFCKRMLSWYNRNS